MSELDDALWEAVGKLKRDEVKKLLEQGANANAQPEKENFSVLIHAIIKGAGTFCREIIEYLVDFGADINYRESKGNTPLMYAISKKDEWTAEFLLKKGADYNIANEKGTTPLSFAQKKGVAGVVSMIQRAENPLTAKMWAEIEHGNYDNVLAYINAGADLESIDSFGWSVLGYICFSGSLELIQELIDAGADVNGGMYMDTLPLTNITTPDYCSVERVKFLLDAGADPNASASVEGSSLLWYAKEILYDDDIADILREYGAEYHDEENEGDEE